MKTTIVTITAIILAGSITPFVSAQGVPEWVKNNAAWWAEGTISDDEFLNAIQHLIKIGMISVSLSHNVEPSSNDSKLAELEAKLDQCSEIKKAYQRLDCEKAAKAEITKYQYELNGVAYKVGPITYYYAGPHFEVMESGQPLLTIKMLAVNTGSETISLMCTGPAICNYDVTDGTKVYKYSSTDFISGNITLKPDQFREFEMMFGPNIGYGGTKFEYDPEKQYVFRINESFGSGSIPVGLE